MVSVIIPTYNRAITIERSVRSVLTQTYDDLECIVVDDGSTDNTIEVIAAIEDPRLHYYKLEQNSGACVARNKGIELAKGDYIAFQDSDDQWRENKLEVQLEALANSGADVCYCKKRRFGVSQKNYDVTLEGLKEGIIPYEDIYKSPGVSTQTILAHRNVFEDFKFDDKVKKAQDYEWAIRAGEQYIFFFVEEILIDQYMQSDSITVKGEKNYATEKETCQYIYKKFQEKYSTNPGLEIALLKRYARFKVLAGENAIEEYKKLYQLTGGKKEYLEYLVEKTGTNLLKRWFLFGRRKNKRLL